MTLNCTRLTGTSDSFKPCFQFSRRRVSAFHDYALLPCQQTHSVSTPCNGSLSPFFFFYFSFNISNIFFDSKDTSVLPICTFATKPSRHPKTTLSPLPPSRKLVFVSLSFPPPTSNHNPYPLAPCFPYQFLVLFFPSYHLAHSLQTKLPLLLCANIPRTRVHSTRHRSTHRHHQNPKIPIIQLRNVPSLINGTLSSKEHSLSTIGMTPFCPPPFSPPKASVWR